MYCALLLTVLVGGCFAASLPEEHKESRVVGGNVAEIGQFPFIISIRVKQLDAHICGGSIIADNWIVTAAHCIYGGTPPLEVVAGSNYLHTGGDRYDVIKELYHEYFSPNPLKNDVALLKVSRNFQYSPYVQRILLSNAPIYDQTPLTVIGWGKTDTNSDLSEQLLYLRYSSIDVNVCSMQLQQVIDNSQICAQVAPGYGSCNGDSGGPLILGNALAGIVSWGIPCAIGAPDVYTNAGYFAKWIVQTMSYN